MSTVLKSCPFCGAKMEIEPVEMVSGLIRYHAKGHHKRGCQLEFASYIGQPTTKKGAIIKWNRRANDECITERAIRMNIVKEIIQERNRQVTDEGYSVQHDDKLDAGQLAEAGSVYASARIDRAMRYPAGWVFKPAERRRELIKSAALIIAELERLYRRADDGTEGARQTKW